MIKIVGFTEYEGRVIGLLDDKWTPGQFVFGVRGTLYWKNKRERKEQLITTRRKYYLANRERILKRVRAYQKKRLEIKGKI